MYTDHRPPQSPSTCPEYVLVVEEDRDQPYDADAIIEEAHSSGAVTNDGEDDIFWIVYASEPRRVWDFTERSLRSSFKS
ncbi:MAG: hypothetical protein UU63_C0022G0001 [Candidatus Uhrbacteria bacterium GW2011_GWF2_41_430]|nr:MAG: hypothetical protein UU63_C0022G0001 [Candidatus Uhrbacteria bacterium GW2011_GWF2_41_430]